MLYSDRGLRKFVGFVGGMRSNECPSILFACPLVDTFVDGAAREVSVAEKLADSYTFILSALRCVESR